MSQEKDLSGNVDASNTLHSLKRRLLGHMAVDDSYAVASQRSGMEQRSASVTSLSSPTHHPLLLSRPQDQEATSWQFVSHASSDQQRAGYAAQSLSATANTVSMQQPTFPQPQPQPQHELASTSVRQPLFDVSSIPSGQASPQPEPRSTGVVNQLQLHQSGIGGQLQHMRTTVNTHLTISGQAGAKCFTQPPTMAARSHFTIPNSQEPSLSSPPPGNAAQHMQQLLSHPLHGVHPGRNGTCMEAAESMQHQPADVQAGKLEADDEETEDDEHLVGGSYSDHEQRQGEATTSGGRQDLGGEDDGLDTGGGDRSGGRRGKGWRKGMKGKLLKGCKAPGTGSGEHAVPDAGEEPAQTSGLRLPAGQEHEECTAAGVSVVLPTDLFRLPGLHCVLNLDTWHEHLSEEERQELRQLLPHGMDEEPGGKLDQLLSGQAPFHFFNPMARLWHDMVAGECHPRVVKYRQGVRLLHEKEHHHNMRDFHNTMVRRLMDMSALFGSMPGQPLEQKLTAWAAMRQGSAGAKAASRGVTPVPDVIVKRRRRRNSKGELVDRTDDPPPRRQPSKPRRKPPPKAGGPGPAQQTTTGPAALDQALQTLASLDDQHSPGVSSHSDSDGLRNGDRGFALTASRQVRHGADDEETESADDLGHLGDRVAMVPGGEFEEDVDILGGRRFGKYEFSDHEDNHMVGTSP